VSSLSAGKYGYPVKESCKKIHGCVTLSITLSCEAGLHTVISEVASKRNECSLCTFLIERHPVVFLILKIKWRYSIETQQQHTMISSQVWLHVSAFSGPSSDQYIPVEDKSVCTIRYGIPYCLKDCVQQL
jgi:hypothetical protein